MNNSKRSGILAWLLYNSTEDGVSIDESPVSAAVITCTVSGFRLVGKPPHGRPRNRSCLGTLRQLTKPRSTGRIHGR